MAFGNEVVPRMHKEKQMKRMMLTLAMLAWSLAAAMAAEPDPQAGEEKVIRKAVESYVSAFNKADAKALAAMWTPEAVYTNPVSSEQAVGREAIEKQFAGLFAEAKGIKLEATTNSIQFVSPGVAIEHGTAKLLQAEQPPEESQYSAVYVKRDGQWLLDRVTEEETVETPTHYEQLKDLEWMVGRWTDQDDQSTVTTECNWSKNNNFLVRSFTVQIRDRIDMSGLEPYACAKRGQGATDQRAMFVTEGAPGQALMRQDPGRWPIDCQTLQSGIAGDMRRVPRRHNRRRHEQGRLERPGRTVR